MKRLSIAILLLTFSGTAFAAAYDDFARGLAANNRDDSDTAIAAFSAALSAGDLSAGLVPAAYYGRAVAYLRKERCGEALPDLDAALAAKPNYPDAKLLHGAANACAKKYEAALADYDAIIAAQPSTAAFLGRAWVHWRRGVFADAAADFAQAAKQNPRFVYPVIWMAMAEARAGTVDAKQIDEAASRFSESDWPVPVLALYTGRKPPEEMAAAVAHGEANELSNRQCESDFYVAEWHLAKKDEGAAKPLLDKAITSCPHSFIEYEAAHFERERVK